MLFGVPRFTRARVRTQPTRFEIAEMPGTHMDVDGVQSAISPDGRTLAYRAPTRRERFGSGSARWNPLRRASSPEPTTRSCRSARPTAKFIGYFSGGQKLMKVAVSGGTPEAICGFKGPRGGTWNRDGVILFAPLSEGPIYRVSANGGEGVPITKLDSTETAHRYPCFLPDGKRFLYSALPPHEGQVTESTWDRWMGRKAPGGRDGGQRRGVRGAGLSHLPAGRRDRRARFD